MALTRPPRRKKAAFTSASARANDGYAEPARRKSFSTTARFSSGGPAAGVTGGLDGLLDYAVIQNGIFGLSDLSSIGPATSVETRSYEGNVGLLETQQIVRPVFQFKQLASLFVSSTTLRECVQAYVRNIESYGSRLEYIGPEGARESRASKAEKKRIEGVLAGLAQGGESLTSARENSRTDKEIFGARAFELLEDSTGRIVGIQRIPANTLLLTKLDKHPTEVPVWNPITRTYSMQYRRFRRYMQRDHDGHVVYFKEVGDPRPINPKTGTVDPSLSIEEEATSLWYDRYYTPGSPYGTPQWSSAIPSMLGAKEAEHVNLSFFRENAIPAMAVLVSGGALTEESFNKIETYFTQSRGAESQNRIVVLEASTDVSEVAGIDGSISAPKVDIKPMLSERQNDGLFKDYISASGDKVRQAMRLPPIYIGHAAEYNRASAFASMQTAEQQVFVPERLAWDSFMNDVVLASYELHYWRVVSVQPVYNDAQETSQLLSVLGKEGALTPNVCIKLANRFMNTDIEQVQEAWGDMPFSATAAALTRGDPVEGFDYLMQRLSDAASTVGTGTSTETSVVQNGVATLLDEISEQGSRLHQYALAA